MISDESCKGRVLIASESIAASWLVAHSYQVGQPLAGTLRQSRPESVFVENELLVDGSDKKTLSLLVDEYQAEILPFPDVPPQPDGMDKKRARSVAEMPLPVTVRLQGERVGLQALEDAAEGEPEGVLHVTSRAGAGTLALARRLASEGRAVMPNVLGTTNILPLSAASEEKIKPGVVPDPGKNPYNWYEFNGPSGVVQAWQLVQAYEQARSLHSPVFLGIFDAGFALGPDGRPTVINAGEAPDVTNFIQWNLFYEGLPTAFGIKNAFEKMGESKYAGGPNNEAGKNWHGNSVLSIAAAPINNKTGAAGAGGLSLQSGTQLVVPVLFKMFRSAKETIRGLQLSVAWGVDIVNMSWSITYPSAFNYRMDPSFPTSLWERTFEWAANQGLIIFAAAGNDGEKLPDRVILPATRTPGVITVGATNNSPADNDMWPKSNYGNSVDIWAPGNNIHVMPSPSNKGIGLTSGTSLAAPLTAGVAALMRAVNPSLRGEDIKRILRETAYKASNPNAIVTHTMNAKAAVLRAMGDRLPAAFGEEPNDTPQTARPLSNLSPGLFGPQGNTFITDRFDEDWYSFSTADYATLNLTLNYVPELSSMGLEVHPDDPGSRFQLDETTTYSRGQVRIQAELIAPGNYRLKVHGTDPNMYILQVKLTPKSLGPDMFENNNTFAKAARFRMKRPGSFSDIADEGGLIPRYYPGNYEANLHLTGDVDYYHIDQISTLGLVKTIFQISNADSPLDVSVLASDGSELVPPLIGERSPSVKLYGPECWLRVSGARANRYHFRLYDVLDQEKIPGPLQQVDIDPIPHSLPYPPDALIDWERFQQVEVTPELIEFGKLRLTGEKGLTLDLLDSAGVSLASAQPVQAGEAQALEIDLAKIKPGTYVARIGRDISPAARFGSGISQRIANFQIGPAW